MIMMLAGCSWALVEPHQHRSPVRIMARDNPMQAHATAGQEMYDLARQLFPICRSITGAGVRETLGILQLRLPDLRIHDVPSGTHAFDWTVPPEWNIRDGYVIAPDVCKIIDFKVSNLHVVGYSEPVYKSLPLGELQKHLYSLPEQPDAIPYVTSYYQRRWGFCLCHRQRSVLQDGIYQAV